MNPRSPFRHPPRYLLPALALASLCALSSGCASMIGGERTERHVDPRTHRVKVESEPAGATVFLDGAEVGQTPLELELPYEVETVERYNDLHWAGYVMDVGWVLAYGVGIIFLIYDASVDGDLIDARVTPRRSRHEVRLRKEGHLDALRLVTAPSTRKLAVTLTPEPLAPPSTPAPAPTAPPRDDRKGRLTVRTDPAGAEIAIDALDFSYVKTAPTPLTNVPLRPGRYRIAVIDSRYRAAAQTIRVRPNDAATVELALSQRREPRPREPEIEGPSGSLLLLSHPDRQSVVVNGAVRGTTPLELRLPVGLQPIEVGGIRFDVEVEPGSLRRLVVNTEQRTLDDLPSSEFAPPGR